MTWRIGSRSSWSAQRRFVADASHQLRSPLTALRLRLENLQIAHPDTSEELEAATNEVLRLSRLIDGLLTLTRAEGARGRREILDVAAVLEERRYAWSALADERHVHLVVDSPPGASGPSSESPLVLARMVPGDLEQILDNLLANALDATPAGRAISLCAAGDRGQVVLHVRDNGPGMSEEERACAFDRFWRGSAAGERSTGLGLAIVQQIVRANGGDIELRAADGGGLDVTVTIERAADVQHAGASPRPPAAPVPSRP